MGNARTLDDKMLELVTALSSGLAMATTSVYWSRAAKRCVPLIMRKEKGGNRNGEAPRARMVARAPRLAWSSLGGGAVRQAHDCPGVDGRSVCNWPNGLPARPAGRGERVNAMAAKEEIERLQSRVRRRSTGSRLRSRPFTRRRGGCGGRRGGWAWSQRCAVRGSQKIHRLRQRRRIRGGKEECPLRVRRSIMRNQTRDQTVRCPVDLDRCSVSKSSSSGIGVLD